MQIGAAMVAGTMVAIIIVDRSGRRKLLIAGGIQMCLAEVRHRLVGRLTLMHCPVSVSRAPNICVCGGYWRGQGLPQRHISPLACNSAKLLCIYSLGAVFKLYY